MPLRSRLRVLLLLGLLTPGRLFGLRGTPQGPSAAPEGKDALAAEPVVVERHETVYRYAADGTGTRLDTLVLRPQTAAGAQALWVIRVPVSAEAERATILYARVRLRDGTVVTTPPEETRDQGLPSPGAMPGEGDAHVLLLPVRGLLPGSRLEYAVRTELRKQEPTGQIWGAEAMGAGAPVLDRTVELHVPASRELLVTLEGKPAAGHVEGAERVWQWQGASPQPATEKATGAVMAWSTFHSWAEVGSWYRQRSEPALAVTPAVKEKAQSLVYGLRSPAARMQALYAYVSAGIRTVGTGWAAASSQPHTATTVLEDQYGDGEDKAVLLLTLLRAEGLPGSLALAGSASTMETAMPSPVWFSRVLVRAGEESGQGLWLDMTPEVAPAGMLEAPLRDREALVVPAEGAARLENTPATPPFAQVDRVEATGTLSAEGDLNGHVAMVLRGDEELRYRAALRSLPETQWDRVATTFLRQGSLAGQPSGTTADAPEKTDGPLHMEFDLRAANYGDWANFRVVSLEPGLRLPLTDRQSPPAEAIALNGPRTETAISHLMLPPGYGADLPGAIGVETPFASLKKQWRLSKGEGGAVVLDSERTLVVKVASLQAADWPAYRKFLDEVARSEPWVQLTMAEGGGAGSGNERPPGTGENRPEAAELVQGAATALASGDLTAARTKLEAARALNERQPYLWSGLGAVAEAEGREAEAEAAYRRELAQHPEEGLVSRLLAASAIRAGHPAEAITVLQAAVARHPQDELSVEMLARLEAGSDPQAAEATCRAGLRANPDSLGLQLQLGTVLVQGAGARRDEGVRLLAGVIERTQRASDLNDAAFALAEANVALGSAEDGARRAIQMLNSQSVAEATQEVAASGQAEEVAGRLRHSQELVAAWDTYGWVLLREGNVSEAEPWLRSAWADSRGGEPGRHLVVLLRKQGRAAEAAGIARALGGEPGGRSLGNAAQVRNGADAGTKGGERVFSVPGGNGTGEAVFLVDRALGVPVMVSLLRGEAGLGRWTDAVGRAVGPALLPPGSPAHLVQEGTLRCRPSGGCVFTLHALGVSR